MLIWIITDTEDGNVIIAASSQEKAQQQLFDYVGYGHPAHTDDVIYHGFNKIEYSEHEDDFIGTFKFNLKLPKGYGDKIVYEWQFQYFNLFSKELNQPQLL